VVAVFSNEQGFPDLPILGIRITCLLKPAASYLCKASPSTVSRKGLRLRVSGCTECERLWEAYANATFKRVRAENALDMAKAVYGAPENMQKLERDLDEASQAADKCHKALIEHEAIAHDGRSLKNKSAG